MELKATLNKVLTPEKSEIVKAAEATKVQAVETTGSADVNFSKAIKRNNELRIKVADILKHCADKATLAYFAKAIEKTEKTTHAN